MDLLGGSGKRKQIPDSSDFLSKYGSVESNVKTYRQQEPLVVEKPAVQQQDPHYPPTVSDKGNQTSGYNETSIDELVTLPQVEQPQAGSKFCPFCGSKNLAEYKFCSNCGTPNPLTSGTSTTTTTVKPVIEPSHQVNELDAVDEAPEGAAMKKRSVWVVFEKVILYIVLLALLGAAGVGGYYVYTTYYGKNNYELAQKALLEQNWEHASVYLNRAVEQHSKGVYELNDKELEAMQQWQIASDNLKVSMPALHSVAGSITTIADYKNAFRDIDKIEWKRLEGEGFGKLNAKVVLLGAALFMDSLREAIIISFIDNTDNFRFDAHSEMIYETASHDSLSLNIELRKLVNHDKRLMDELGNNFFKVSNRVLDTIPSRTNNHTINTSAIADTSKVTIAKPATSPPASVSKSQKPQTSKQDRNYD